MRFVTLVLILLLTGFVVFFAGWFRPQSKPAVARLTAPAATTPAVEEAATFNVAPTRFDASAPSSLPVVAVMDAADLQAVENRIAELETLALNDDTNSLNLILIALADANPQIRDSALEATIQFGSTDAIPTLQSVLAKTEQTGEKVKIQEAIEFLKLPPLATAGTPMP